MLEWRVSVNMNITRAPRLYLHMVVILAGLVRVRKCEAGITGGAQFFFFIIVNATVKMSAT